MKNTKFIFNFPAFTLKERFAICKGPGEAPLAPKTGSETVKPNSEAQKTMLEGSKLYDFLVAKEQEISSISKPDEKDEYDSTFKAEGYKISISGHKNNNGSTIWISAEKGGNKLGISFEVKGRYYSLTYNGQYIAISDQDPKHTQGDQVLFREKIKKIHGIIERALGKAKEKAKEKANKEVKDF